MEEHNIKVRLHNYKSDCTKELMDRDLIVCVNSDDPAYFSSYINDNYIRIYKAHNLTRAQIFKVRTSLICKDTQARSRFNVLAVEKWFLCHELVFSLIVVPSNWLCCWVRSCVGENGEVLNCNCLSSVSDSGL